MVFTDHYGDDDPDKALGIPDEFAQRAMLAEAINRANRVDQELHGRVTGMLADYMRHAQEEAAAAAAELLVSHPRDERATFELQKRAAAYASLIAWVRAVYSDGQAREIDLTELDEEKEHGEEV